MRITLLFVLMLILVASVQSQVCWLLGSCDLITGSIEGHQRDVFGKLFTFPGNAILDTFYFAIDNVGSANTHVKIRIFKSKIGSHSGPSFGPYASGCQNWGYFVNAFDPDQGITPFRDVATDTHWVSTIGGATPSFYPLGNEIWGLGGFLVTLVPNSMNKVTLTDLGAPITVSTGDSIFVTIEIVPSANPDLPVEFVTNWYDPHIAPKEESESLVQTGIWKFYEHNVGTSFSDVPPIKGWRYLTGAVDTVSPFGLRPPKPYLKWAFMVHPTGNMPPKFLTLSRINNTMSTGGQTVQSEISDSNGANRSSAGVKSTWAKYAVVYSDGTFDSARVSMSHTGPGDIWQGTIPGQLAGSMISYWVEAVDSQGLFARTLPVTYQVLDTRTDHYFLDTVSVPGHEVWTDPPISSSNFFLPPGNYQDRPPATDNGTAGPFDLGGPFVFFGHPGPDDTIVYRYAWIGVDGAIALTASPTDTQHINSNGFFGSLWDIPGQTRLIPVIGAWDMPKNFIAPLYTDMVLSDSLGTYGSIKYRVDTAQFIVEWDSVKVKDTVPIMSKALPISQPMGITAETRVKFRLILNRKEGTVEFHYNNMPRDVNVYHRTLVGMQGEVSTPWPTRNWSNINKNGYPTELQPRSNRSFTFYPVVHVPVRQRWNMVSVPMYPINGDRDRASLFPNSVYGTLYQYGPGSRYVQAESLMLGRGYWLKFTSAETVLVAGKMSDSCEILVTSGWNLIGSISYPVNVSSITTSPPGMIGSQFFGYSGSYVVEDIMQPGKAHWVKVSNNGSLIMKSSGEVNPAKRLKIVATSELPPPPPNDVVSEPTNLPKEYALEQNYPNPFNPVTLIKYALPLDGKVRLEVFNTLGQRIAVLVNSQQQAGYHDVAFDAARFGSGVYFYRLQAGNFTETKKLILLK